MNNDLYWDQFYRRVKSDSRQYFFEKLNDHKGRKISYSDLLSKMKDDGLYIFRSLVYMLYYSLKYGNLIRREYKISIIKQLYRQLYLLFVLRTEPVHFRTRLLYKDVNWAKVDEYIYTQRFLPYRVIEPFNRGLIQIIEDKFKFYKFCKKNSINTPDIITAFKNGEQIFKEKYPDGDLFLKKCSGGKGTGSQLLSYENGNYHDKSGNTFSTEELKDKFKNLSLEIGPVIVQRALKNHSSWMKYSSGGLSTCRLVMAIHPENLEVIPLFCCIKMPVGNMHLDNFAKGAIIAPIDLEKGRIGLGVTQKPYLGKFEFSAHPDTNVPFEGSYLEHFQDLVEFTVSAHLQFKTLFVGWDVSMTEQGPCLIEGNIGWASGSYEIPFQDTLKNTIYPELFEKWMKKFV